MIVRITFIGSHQEKWTMLFGNSYKNWYEQFCEYVNNYIVWKDSHTIMRCGIFGIAEVETSQSAWIGWGGLKWCLDHNFQYRLNREGRQDNDTDNPNPRKYSEMVFKPSMYARRKVIYKFRQRLRHFNNIKSPEKLEQAILSDIQDIEKQASGTRKEGKV